MSSEVVFYLSRVVRKAIVYLSRTRKQLVLRAGFGIIIALLIFSALQADRIQDSASRQTVEVYQRYAKEQDVLSEFRRNLLIGSIYARDYFLSAWPDRAEQYRSQLQHLRIDMYGGLDQIQNMPGMQAQVGKLRARAEKYLNTLEKIPADTARPERAFEMVDADISSQRGFATQIVTNMVQANQAALKKSETDFEERRRQATHRLFLMLSFCLFLAAAVALFSIIYAELLEQRSARRYRDAMEAKRDLQLLSGRLLEIQEEERRSFSRELHDHIGQLLTALRMEISHAQTVAKGVVPAVQSRLEHARSLAESTIESVRDISLMLRPSLLDDLGLGPALEWQVEEFTRRSGVPCALKVGGLGRNLPDGSKTCVFRVVQEALHNCEKHSGAKHVRVEVQQTAGVLTVEVVDDGRGFEINKAKDKPRRPAGLGLLGMRERAEMIGGRVTIESKLGEGTRLQLRIPVPDPLPAGEELIEHKMGD